MSVATAAFPNRPPTSPFLALLWKEWRQQRWVALPLAALPLVLSLGIYIFVPASRTDPSPLVAGLVVLPLLPLILGANAFCGEQDDETAEFLRLMPAGGLRPFAAKILFVWGATLITATLLALLALAMYPALFDWLRHFTVPPDWRDRLNKGGLLDAAGGMGLLFMLAILPALVSAWVRRTLPCVLVSIAVACGLSAWTFWSMYMLSTGIRRIPSPKFMAALVFPAAGFVVVAVLIAAPAMWIWSRSERSLKAKLIRLALVVGLLLVLPGAPTASHYSWRTFFAPPGAFAAGYMPSPDGRTVAASCYYRPWGEVGSRIALVTSETGRYRWLTRLHWSGAFWRGWSPSGDRLVWTEGTNLRPFSLRRYPMDKAVTWIADINTGTNARLDALCPDIAAHSRMQMNPIGWINEDQIAFLEREAVLFADLRTGRVDSCRRGGKRWPNLVSKRGLFFGEQAPPERDGVPSVAEALRILRYAPGLYEPEAIMIRMPESAPSSTVSLVGVSPDGLWAVVTVSDESSVRSYFVSPIQDNAALRFVCSRAEHSALMQFRHVGFSQDSAHLLLHDNHNLMVFTLADGELRTIPITPEDSSSVIWQTTVSPDGRYAASQVQGGSQTPYCVVTDLDSEFSHEVPMPAHGRITWLGNDRLLLETHSEEAPWIISRDGGEVRPLFKEE